MAWLMRSTLAASKLPSAAAARAVASGEMATVSVAVRGCRGLAPAGVPALRSPDTGARGSWLSMEPIFIRVSQGAGLSRLM
jgi:hypothetical protein